MLVMLVTPVCFLFFLKLKWPNSWNYLFKKETRLNIKKVQERLVYNGSLLYKTIAARLAE